MRKNILLSLLVTTIALTGCKSDSDVLASFNGGEITRGDFYGWIETRHLSKKVMLKSKAKQKAKLKQIALDKMCVAEAKKAGYDKTEDFQRILSLVKDNFTANNYRKNMRKDVSFNEKAVDVSIIKLRVKNYKIVKNKRKKLSQAELKAAIDKKRTRAAQIIAELDKGGDFAALAKKHSNDYSKKKGGKIGYLTMGMRNKAFMEAAFKLKKGEFTREPVVVRNSLYIIKVNDKTELTNKNIEDKIEDEKQKKRLSRRLQSYAARNSEKKLLESKDVVNNIDKVNFADPKAVIFKIGDNPYLVKDLNELIAFIDKKRTGAGRKELSFDKKKKKGFSTKLFREKLMAREAEKKGITAQEKFKKEWATYYEYTLANAYKNDVILKGVTVTPKEVRDAYERDKKRRQARMKRQKGKKRRVAAVKPFNQVKDRIEYMLHNRKKAAKRRNWEKQMLAKNNFTVYEDKLEEVK